MKNRILTGWNFQRAFYLLMGLFVIVNAIMTKQWFGAIFGAYFASMGLFSFGCAAGACYTSNNTQTPTTNDIQNVEFEEVK
ncbi:MAG TPA: hypothetical protein PK431_11795 [Chitinophagales bacterium]|nr:hypothetical protein [Chitinophagales bacterium]